MILRKRVLPDGTFCAIRLVTANHHGVTSHLSSEDPYEEGIADAPTRLHDTTPPDHTADDPTDLLPFATRECTA